MCSKLLNGKLLWHLRLFSLQSCYTWNLKLWIFHSIWCPPLWKLLWKSVTQHLERGEVQLSHITQEPIFVAHVAKVMKRMTIVIMTILTLTEGSICDRGPPKPLSLMCLCWFMCLMAPWCRELMANLWPATQLEVLDRLCNNGNSNLCAREVRRDGSAYCWPLTIWDLAHGCTNARHVRLM